MKQSLIFIEIWLFIWSFKRTTQMHWLSDVTIADNVDLETKTRVDGRKLESKFFALRGDEVVDSLMYPAFDN